MRLNQFVQYKRKPIYYAFLLGASLLSSCGKSDTPTPKPIDPIGNQTALKEDISVSTDGLEILTNGTGKFYRPGTAYYFATSFVWDKDAQGTAKGKKVIGKYEGAGIDQIESYLKNSSGNYVIVLKTDNIKTIFSNTTKILEREDKKTFSNNLSFTDTPYRKISTDAKTAEGAKALFDKFSKMNHEVTITTLSELNVMIIASQKYVLAN